MYVLPLELEWICKIWGITLCGDVMMKVAAASG
jgi:hypothetical protein